MFGICRKKILGSGQLIDPCILGKVEVKAKNKTMKKYNVIWEESHAVIVEAENEEKAIEKVMDGFGSDDSVEISVSPEAIEIKERSK